MFLRIPYGNQHKAFHLEDERILNLVTPQEVEPATDPYREIERALATPISGNRINEIASNGKRVAIAVDDITRTTPTHLLLPPLFQQLQKAGIAKDAIDIFVALGTHRPMTDAEMKNKYGAEIVEEYNFVNHAFHDPSQLTYVDDMAENVPVWINKGFMNADIRIVTGNVIPHFNAGWAAGAKILLPGLAGEETVGRMHVHSGLTTPNGLGLEDNPTRQLIDEFGAKVSIHLLVNTVITRHCDIIKAYAGHFVQAHRQGIEHAKTVYSVPITGHADITISSSYPADIEYWQGLKGLFSAALATKQGGGILETTPCLEGVSVMHPQWIEYLQYDTATLKDLLNQGKVEDHVAFGLALNVAHIREHHPVFLISDGISDKHAEKMQFHKYDTIDEALAVLTRKYGAQSSVNILTHGGETYPVIA